MSLARLGSEVHGRGQGFGNVVPCRSRCSLRDGRRARSPQASGGSGAVGLQATSKTQPMALFIVEKHLSGVTLLDLRGRITLGEETEQLRNKVKQLAESGQARIIIDLGEVDYVDSGGLGALVGCSTAVRKSGGELKLLRLTKRLRDLLQITRLSTLFEVHDAVEQAVRSFEPKPTGK